MIVFMELVKLTQEAHSRVKLAYQLLENWRPRKGSASSNLAPSAKPHRLSHPLKQPLPLALKPLAGSPLTHSSRSFFFWLAIPVLPGHGARRLRAVNFPSSSNCSPVVEWLVPPIDPEVRSRLDCWLSYDHRRHPHDRESRVGLSRVERWPSGRRQQFAKLP